MDAFRLGDWRVEPQLNTIADGDRTTRLEPKVMKVLVCLAQQPGQVIAKERLLQTVWPDTFVTDDVLTHAVSELRRALGDDPRGPRYIQTIPKGGYRLVAVVAGADVPATELLPPRLSGPSLPPTETRWRVRLAAAASMTAVALAVAAGWLGYRRASHRPDRVVRLSLNLPAPTTLGSGIGHAPAFSISPDGRRVVYAASAGGKVQLYLRHLDAPAAQAIPGTEGAMQPFFSTDGEWVGFVADGDLKKVPLRHGTAATLCRTPTLRGASWTSRGTIVYSPTYDGGLWEVADGGGAPKQLTAPDPERGENSHRWPVFLPDGRSVLFTVRHGGNFDDAEAAVLDLESGRRRTLFRGGTFAQYAPTGHVVYGRQTSLLAVAFDLARLEIRGAPFRVMDGIVAYQDSGTANFSLSRDGSLAYVTPAEGAAARSLVWVDDHGVSSPILETPRAYQGVRLSPDGRRLAVSIVEGADPGIWILDLGRGVLSRATLGRGNDHAIWHPDGHITYTSDRSGPWNLFLQSPEDIGEPERLTTARHWQWPTSWSSDGRLLAYTETNPTTNSDIWVMDRQSGKPTRFVATSRMQTNAAFSPDGRWVAYVSTESGAGEVYVRPYPGPGDRWQVSIGGGAQPVWDPTGGKLFYRNGPQMLAVAITTRPRFRAGQPRVVFEGRYWSSFVHHAPEYDVVPGGRRFVMIKENERGASPTEIKIVVNWFDELAGQAPGRR